MNVFLWIVSGIGGVGMLILLFRPFFPHPGDFQEALSYSLRPDWLSALRGEYWDDVWKSMKLDFYVLIGMLAVVTFRKLLGMLFGCDM